MIEFKQWMDHFTALSHLSALLDVLFGWLKK